MLEIMSHVFLIKFKWFVPHSSQLRHNLSRAVLLKVNGGRGK